MAFGKPNRSVRHLLTPGQPVELAIQLNGGSAKVIGLPKDNTTDVAAADPAEQAMEGVIAELSAALYLVDIDFTLHAEIIEEMITGESERSEEHTSELQSLMRISYAVFCLKKKKHHKAIMYCQSIKE